MGAWSLLKWPFHSKLNTGSFSVPVIGIESCTVARVLWGRGTWLLLTQVLVWYLLTGWICPSPKLFCALRLSPPADRSFIIYSCNFSNGASALSKCTNRGTNFLNFNPFKTQSKLNQNSIKLNQNSIKTLLTFIFKFFNIQSFSNVQIKCSMFNVQCSKSKFVLFCKINFLTRNNDGNLFLLFRYWS